MVPVFAVVDLETGELLEGVPGDDLIVQGSGDAWQFTDEPGLWHSRTDGDPPGISYRLVQVVVRGDDPGWYENTVENLDTSEG